MTPIAPDAEARSSIAQTLLPPPLPPPLAMGPWAAGAGRGGGGAGAAGAGCPASLWFWADTTDAEMSMDQKDPPCVARAGAWARRAAGCADSALAGARRTGPAWGGPAAPGSCAGRDCAAGAGRVGPAAATCACGCGCGCGWCGAGRASEGPLRWDAAAGAPRAVAGAPGLRIAASTRVSIVNASGRSSTLTLSAASTRDLAAGLAPGGGLNCPVWTAT